MRPRISIRGCVPRSAGRSVGPPFFLVWIIATLDNSGQLWATLDASIGQLLALFSCRFPFFLVMCTRLYKSPCRSVCRSVRRRAVFALPPPPNHSIHTRLMLSRIRSCLLACLILLFRRFRAVFRRVLASLYEGLSVRPSVRL